MYRNTQFGTVIVGMVVVAIGFCLWIATENSWPKVTVAVLAILVAILMLFWNLTVEVTSATLRCSFGVGLISKTIPMRQVTGAVQVRNHWYYGWGIRRVPGAWMFNVSGLDSVEVTLDSGKRFRIGTNDPTGLLSAIEQTTAVGT
jgi:hypothetical protein